LDFSGFDIVGPTLIKPKRFADERGHFSETFKAKDFEQSVGQQNFVQDNESLSILAGTIRGLHYQSPPHAQGKLVRCIAGEICDVAVDVRSDSPTYLEHIRVFLSAKNGYQLWIPVGFLHGFSTLVPNTLVSYKVTHPYHSESDRSLAFDDPRLNIDWGLGSLKPTLSAKDKEAPLFDPDKSPF
jgi:dTDP-4-dehydrorhamnose 3,5-epimerase